jgi:hypothetical protein
MNLFTAMFTTMALLVSASTEAQTLIISRGDSRPDRPAPAENFADGVRVEPLFEALVTRFNDDDWDRQEGTFGQGRMHSESGGRSGRRHDRSRRPTPLRTLRRSRVS